MKSAASINSKTDSPKTPGGISKALLTPCRRLGLSRNWRKSGPSPFNSPLSSSEIKQNVEKIEKKTRKRKEVGEDTENVQNDENESIPLAVEVNTPLRNVELPCRKKSKTLLSTLNTTSENQEDLSKQTADKKNSKDNSSDQNTNNIEETAEITVEESISTPVRLKSKSKSKKKSPVTKKVINETSEFKKENLESKIETDEGKNIMSDSKIQNTKVDRSKVKSPNNLTKECIVVIQKKIFKEELNSNDMKNKHPNKTSQSLFDSDTDDIPLCQINKEENQPIYTEEDDDFETTTKTRIQDISKKITLTTKPKKTETVTQISQNSDEENKRIEKPKKDTPTAKPKKTNCKTQKIDIKTQHSQNSDDDDDFVEKKQAIVVKKSYDKIPKPVKAKSTGSITQKDIDELKLRIEKKKKLLLAKAMTDDTKELRDLIKKWQKGCQDALLELMDLMKNKMPDENMDYSAMLKALKIPAHLVGYDSENDNFCTPSDESIILTNLGD